MRNSANHPRSLSALQDISSPTERASRLYVELQRAVAKLDDIEVSLDAYRERDPYGRIVADLVADRNAQFLRVTMLGTLYQVERHIADHGVSAMR